MLSKLNILILFLIIYILEFGQHFNVNYLVFVHNFPNIAFFLSLTYALFYYRDIVLDYRFSLVTIFIYFFSFATKNYDILFLYCIALLFLKSKPKELIITILIVFFSRVILQFSLYAFGFIKDDIHFSTLLGFEIKRHSFGMGHPNTLYLYAFLAFVYYLYLKGYYSVKDRVVYLLVLSCFFILTCSRTGYIISLLMIPAEYVINKRDKLPKYFKYLTWLLFPLGFILSVILLLVFGRSPNFVNTILSNRPFYWHYYFASNPFTFLGGSLVEGYYLDNLYLYAVITSGIIGLIIFSIVFGQIGKYAYQKNDKPMYIFCLIIFFQGLTEATIFNVGLAFIVPLFFIYFFSDVKSYEI